MARLAVGRQACLIRCYHGLGDTLQFIRYVPLIKAVATEVTVLAQVELIPLLETLPGIDHCVALDAAVPLDYAVDVEVMELPYILRTCRETIPAENTVLSCKKYGASNMRSLAVGIVWAAGDWIDLRSIPLAELHRSLRFRQ